MDSWWAGNVPKSLLKLLRQYLGTGEEAPAETNQRFRMSPGPEGTGTQIMEDTTTGAVYLVVPPSRGDPTAGIKPKDMEIIATIKPPSGATSDQSLSRLEGDLKAGLITQDEYNQRRRQLSLGLAGQEDQASLSLANAKFDSDEKQRAFENALKGTPEEAALARQQLMRARDLEMRLSEAADRRAAAAEERAWAGQMSQMATEPTAWAALATRGAKAEGPVNALDWYRRGVESINLPQDQYRKHLQDIGGAPDTPEMREAWSKQYRGERGMGEPFSLPGLQQMPWFQSLSQGRQLPGYRLTPEAVSMGLSNQNFLQTLPYMTGTERSMLAGTAGSTGMNLNEWITSMQQKLPRGQAARRW